MVEAANSSEFVVLVCFGGLILCVVDVRDDEKVRSENHCVKIGLQSRMFVLHM